ncbi:succinate dehydrogenase/fumarate reductase iron-sulfur subunit [Cellulosimicrobium arenosum]|uniref:succinate dehydrogenase n=1 Tax=Cellulosimicrobium arenosum TaxID=2708133 RepID=A0A927J1R7_9MICO|nr:2Fe-2S iron-sulfur cluster-binding protein [Cellulosimicrobium arenosum]MBD8080303.1 4Fe-4S dicluster domain-containing protein [Cellulosimicrobium arenosum]
MSGQTVRLEVARQGAGTAEGGARDVFDVPYDERTSVLDALQWVKDHADPTLTFRWSCKMAVCGSCGVMVNGRPVLGCETFVRGYRTTGLVVEPLAHAAVLRDLVVDTDTFVGKLAAVKPWQLPVPTMPDGAVQLPLVSAEPAPRGGQDASHPDPAPGPGEDGLRAVGPASGSVQSPGELAAFKGFAECIDCMLCYAACPQLEVAPDFLGPAVVATARRWDEDSRDDGELDRADLLDTEFGVWPCIQVGACTQVCPKGVDPARALRDAQRVATETWESRQTRTDTPR